jgi:hypothetical protein
MGAIKQILGGSTRITQEVDGRRRSITRDAFARLWCAKRFSQYSLSGYQERITRSGEYIAAQHF